MEIQKHYHDFQTNTFRYLGSKFSLPLQFKGMILLFLSNKHRIKKDRSVRNSFFQWYARMKLSKNKKQAGERMLVCQKISNCCFFYRLKRLCNIERQKVKENVRSEKREDGGQCIIKKNLRLDVIQEEGLEESEMVEQSFQWVNERMEDRLGRVENQFKAVRMRTMVLLLDSWVDRYKKHIYKNIFNK